MDYKYRVLLHLIKTYLLRLVVHTFVVVVPSCLIGCFCITGAVLLNIKYPWTNLAFCVGAIPSVLLLRKFANSLKVYKKIQLPEFDQREQ
jgi:hypothetical protein